MRIFAKHGDAGNVTFFVILDGTISQLEILGELGIGDIFTFHKIDLKFLKIHFDVSILILFFICC